MTGLSLQSGDTSRAGEKIYKGHRSYDLMLNLQLGIRYSVGRITPEHCPDKLDSTHFGAKVATSNDYAWSERGQLRLA